MDKTNESQEYISIILDDIASLYTERKHTFFANSKKIVKDVYDKKVYSSIIGKSSIESFLCSLTNITYGQKDQLHSLDFDKMINWQQLYLADQERHILDGHNFNVFKLFAEQLNVNIKETMHSKLLKFLLDKRASHGQGTRFLELFLNKLGIYQPELGQWEVTAEQGRIDILIKRKTPHSIIVIENKSNWANDQPNQLYRYWYNQIYSDVKNIDEKFYELNMDKYQIVYLSPNINKKVEEQSLSKPVEWADSNLPSRIPLSPKMFTFDDFIQDWLSECENKLSENNRVRHYIAQYKELCKIL